MDNLLRDFKQAIDECSGYGVAACITPEAPKTDPGRLYAFFRGLNEFGLHNDLQYALVYNNNLELDNLEVEGWIEIFAAYWKAVGELLAVEELQNQGRAAEARWDKVYEAWKEVVNLLIRYFTDDIFPAWQIPSLYVGGRYLRIFAIKADEQSHASNGTMVVDEGFQDDVVAGPKKDEHLEDAARQVMRIFTCCVGDRSSIDDSRKWGVYYAATLMFKIHFRLNSTRLSKNILRTIGTLQADMPAFSAYPKAQQVTFNFFAGVIHFLDEDYKKAEEYLTQAWLHCRKDSHKNRQLILIYLIPVHLLTANELPSSELLSQYPRINALFRPLCAAIKHGDLKGFDAALEAEESTFIKRRIYLALERSRDTALRNVLRKVFIAGGYDPLQPGQAEVDRVRRSRIPVSEFTAAVRLSSGPRGKEDIDIAEVECMLANMIYKNLMKGYISRERGIVVLNKKGAFPGTGV